MGYAYVIRDQGAVHFVTFTVHQWVDVFTRRKYVNMLLDNLEYCQINKGLEIYAWVVMSNHCHLIVSAKEEDLSDIIRDFKKHTSKAIFKAIENNKYESRKEWLLKTLKYNDRIWFWQEGYHGEEITSSSFYDSKPGYIHLNPVRAELVEKEDEYLHSSAGDLYGVRKGRLKLSPFK